MFQSNIGLFACMFEHDKMQEFETHLECVNVDLILYV